MRISEIRSPDMFQRLVHKVFMAEYGDDYVVLDDSGGDGGMDGYLHSKKQLHAIYCPEKPESADFARKIRSDVDKANRLKTNGPLGIESFAFITPVPLRKPQLDLLIEESEKVGFVRAVSLSDEYLEVLYHKHPDLKDQFPELNYPRVEEEIRRNTETIREVLLGSRSRLDHGNETDNASDDIDEGIEPTTRLFEPDLDDELSMLAAQLVEDRSVIAKLTAYRLGPRPTRKQLLAMSFIVDFRFGNNELIESESVAREAAELARTHELFAYEAYFRAMIARAVSNQAAQMDLRTVHETRMANATGVPFTDDKTRQERIETMQNLREQANEEIRKALKLSSQAMNMEAFWSVLVQFASMNAVLAYPNYTIQDWPRVETALKVIQNAFERLFTIAPYLGPETTAQTFIVYAGMLDSLGKKDDARAYFEQGKSIVATSNLDHIVPMAEDFQSRHKMTDSD